MALTPLRWIAMLVAVALLATYVAMRLDKPSPLRTGKFDALEMRAGTAASEARDAARALRLAQLLDSTHAGAVAGVKEPVRVLIEPGVPAAARAPLAAMVDAAIRDVGSPREMGIDVFVVYDTLHLKSTAVVTYGGSIEYVLPSKPGDRCALIYRLPKDPPIDRLIVQTLKSEQAAPQFLGPCPYYGAFGFPGPRIDAWLRARGWAFAGDGSWRHGMDVLRPNRYGESTGPLSFASPLKTLDIGAVRCQMADPGACGPLVFEFKRSQFTFAGDNVLHAPYPMLGRGRYSFKANRLGPREPFLFADMVRRLGPERFHRFWKSSAEPRAAFEEAAGESTDAWISRWMTGHYGPLPPKGPAMSVRVAIVSAVLIGLAGAAAAVTAAHRTFG